MNSTSFRSVVGAIPGRATSDGAGVSLRRYIGTPELEVLDPFLMLDAFGSDDPDAHIAGFPDHPHRGFETVTYMLAGRMRHGDNKGNVGLLGPGSVQWMTAGRGIVHSEMPEQETGRMAGFQLWVNLPAKDKMCAPRYQDIAAERIPCIDDAGGATVKIIAGSVGGTKGPVDGIATDPLYLDVMLPAGKTFETALPSGHNAFLHVHDKGAARIVWNGGARLVARGELAVLGAGEALRVEAENEESRFILVAGRPLREPIAKYGPFVMTTREEIVQAIHDFQEGRF